jgi:hypothetical protein
MKLNAQDTPLPFSYALIDEFLASMISENELFQSATNPILPQKAQKMRICVAYYAGMKHLIAGDKIGAENLFEKCVDSGQVNYGEEGYDEYGSAEAELQALKKE